MKSCRDELALLAEYSVGYEVQHLTDAQCLTRYHILLTSLMNVVWEIGQLVTNLSLMASR
jgi:hypothetical protein